MDKQETETIIITEEEQNERLDRVLANRYKEIKSRTYFQNLIRDHQVLLNGEPVKKQVKPKAGDEVEIYFSLTPEMDIMPENIPLAILYEDEAILIVNKAAGMVVHPATGNWSGTFVNALLFHCKHLPGNFQEMRPGIVHRLDKDTSGVLVCAKTVQAQQRLIEMFAAREVYKEYLAICLGNPGDGVFTGPIGRHPVHRKQMAVCETGRSAVTRYKTLAFNGKISLVSLVLETGRTHQIRVHLSHHRTPVLGDAVYGNAQSNKKYKAMRQMLHAHLLRFKHPITGEMIECIAEVPADMTQISIF